MTAERAIVCRGIRGATTASANTAEEILESTHELLNVVIRLNEIDPADIASVIFTTTPDLTATFPALAARQIGWTEVPLICTHEMSVPGALTQAIRVLIHINTSKTASEIKHVYLKGAVQLRPEWGYSDEQVAEIQSAELARS